VHRTKGEAILLRREPINEADRLLTLFHPARGTVRLVAKAARKSKKRFLGALEPCTRLEVEFVEIPNRAYGRLESSDVLAAFPRFRRELPALAQAAYACELAGLVARPGEPAEALYAWLVLFLTLVDQDGPDAATLRAFELGVLDRGGLGPPLDRCAACGRGLEPGARPAFDTARGGALCPRCGTGTARPVSLGTRRTLAAARRGDPPLPPRIGFSRQALQESRRLLGEFLGYHLEQQPRTRRYLDQVCPEVA